jgi:hypothetical protein
VRRRHDFCEEVMASCCWDGWMNTDLDFCPFDYASEIIKDADVWCGSRVKSGEALARNEDEEGMRWKVRG